MDRSCGSELEALRSHLSAVETELARYAAAYGLSDQARRLMILSPLAASAGKLTQIPEKTTAG